MVARPRIVAETKQNRTDTQDNDGILSPVHLYMKAGPKARFFDFFWLRERLSHFPQLTYELRSLSAKGDWQPKSPLLNDAGAHMEPALQPRMKYVA